VHHGFIYGVAGFVRKNAGGQTRDHLDAALFVRRLQDIIVDEQVVALKENGIKLGSESGTWTEAHQKVQVVVHVVEQTSHHCGQVDNMSGLLLGEECLRGCQISEETFVYVFVQSSCFALTHVKSASLEPAKYHCSSAGACSLITDSRALPTRPVPPVTSTFFIVFVRLNE